MNTNIDKGKLAESMERAMGNIATNSAFEKYKKTHKKSDDNNRYLDLSSEEAEDFGYLVYDIIGFFNYLSNPNGLITPASVLFATGGEVEAVDAVKIIINEFDVNKDGGLDFQEYLKALIYVAYRIFIEVEEVLVPHDLFVKFLEFFCLIPRGVGAYPNIMQNMIQTVANGNGNGTGTGLDLQFLLLLIIAFVIINGGF